MAVLVKPHSGPTIDALRSPRVHQYVSKRLAESAGNHPGDPRSSGFCRRILELEALAGLKSDGQLPFWGCIVTGYQIGPFDEPSVAEIAAFLIQSLDSGANAQDSSGGDDHRAHGRSGLTRDYRWLLDENNPARSEGIPAGEVIRNDQGKVIGMIGCHPVVFRLGDRRLLGLGAHNFFVDPSARMQGFILFRRYLNNPKADFCYSTTCSPNVGPLWSKCGAAHLPGSDSEFVLVLRYGPVLQEAAISRGVPRPLAGALLQAGPLVGLVSRAHRRRGPLRLEWCDDWERLAAIAEQNRDPSRLTPERSVAVLRHQYAAMARNAKSAGSWDGAYRFTASSGREGWFSVTERLRGAAASCGV